MATKLYLRSTTTNAIGSTYQDMVTTEGSGSINSVTNTTASGTEIQLTATAGGSLVQWVSGRVPAGGFTLTTSSIQLRALESDMSANCGGRARIFKRAADGTETELGGGPFNDGAEFGTSSGNFNWTCDVTDTAFAENDRILLKLYLTNVGTMGGGFTCTITYESGLDTVDSYLSINENVTFKPEKQFSIPPFSRTPKFINRRPR